MEQRRALGRGIESLIPSAKKTGVDTVTADREESPYRFVAIDKVVPNRQQPRTVFDEEKLRELSASIKEEGVLQPLVVTKLPDARFELIAGERRLRASRLAGLEKVPVIIMEADPESVLVLSILENIQREDLNPIEEAMAYQELVEQYQHTHEQIARKMGKSRVSVANSLRLLNLPQVVREDIAQNRYSPGHARALLGLTSIHEQLKMRETIIKNMPTVRDVERFVRERTQRVPRSGGKATLSPDLQRIVDQLKQATGTKVQLKLDKRGKGKLSFEVYSEKDLSRLYSRILGESS